VWLSAAGGSSCAPSAGRLSAPGHGARVGGVLARCMAGRDHRAGLDLPALPDRLDMIGRTVTRSPQAIRLGIMTTRPV